MPYIKFEELTADQLEILADKSNTAKEIQQHLGCGLSTISRWRKMLDIQPGRGSKPKKPRPWQEKKVKLSCKVCGKQTDVVPYRVDTFKYCSRECMHRSEDYIAMLKNIDRSYMQTEQYRQTKRKPDTPEYRKYRNRVSSLTRRTYDQHKNIINPNQYPRTIAGVDGGYHLDHKISCREGFEKNMTPEQISEVTNLQMLPWLENVTKGCK